ncbi:hypothetical protein SAMN03159424_04404 [Pseudomonas sp. NFACC05-1]|nr:hypothetical protein SAMN03159424_04404 [Pseudomonas sp. NFACC05-1]
MKCTSRLGHKYRARYDSEPMLDFQVGRITPSDMCRFLEPGRKQTYVHDVCERCGHIVRREPTP